MKNKLKIAVVGSGISGLTASYYLSKVGHEVELFEADERIGGHTNTVDVTENNQIVPVDTGFIVCNNRNYPNFLKLMQELGVELIDSEMSFSVKKEDGTLEYNGTTLNTLFCQRLNLFRPSFYRMIFDILRFNKEATKYYLDGLQNGTSASSQTIEEYLAINNYTPEFMEHYIMPMGAAIWSASRAEMKEFPLDFFVRFFYHHGMLTVNDRPQWMVLKGGSKAYLPKIIANFKSQIHLNSPVVGVKNEEYEGKLKVNVSYLKHGARESKIFDQVVLALHGDQILKLLDNPSAQERSILSQFSFRQNETVLHTDTSVLPVSPLGHASWNYFLPKSSKNSISVTYHMNILQRLKTERTYLVSLNMTSMIDPKKVIKIINYNHPVYTRASVTSQGRWQEISGKRGIHYCGAYWANGFHEDGVKTALRVVELIENENNRRN